MSFNPWRTRQRARAILLMSLGAIALTLLAPANASAQQDTTRHTMPGMPGMKMPATAGTPARKATTDRKATAKTAKTPKTVKTAKTAKTAAKKPSVTRKTPRAPKQTTKAATKAEQVMPATDTTHRDMNAMPGMPAKRDSMPPMHDMPATRDMPAMHDMPATHDTGATKKMAGMPGMPGMKMIDGPLGIPMERSGSGTSWLPDDSPMHAYHIMAGSWELMLHGVAFAMYDKQGSLRGDEQFSSVNWGMLMATRELGGGRLQLRGMMSAEPWTIGGRGYPLLLQTGETWRGEPLHDRQHPHDLFMELAALYEHAVSDRVGVSLYVAPVGEPAIGPVAFPHRPSAMNDPMAPISHHWQDATHITFGVLTAGVFTHSVRLEGSLFNGREPDENRTNFDYTGRRLDSYAGRLAWNPSSHWSLNGSYAYLASPEETKPDESVHRMSASVMNGRTFGRLGELATTFVFGANRHSNSAHLEPSYLLESNLEVAGAHSVFARAEHVQKSADDLVLGAGGPTGEYDITSLSGGYVYEFDRAGNVRTGIGVRGSMNILPSALEPYYGTGHPMGLGIYLRIRPQRMSEGHDTRTGAGHQSAGHGGTH